MVEPPSLSSHPPDFHVPFPARSRSIRARRFPAQPATVFCGVRERTRAPAGTSFVVDAMDTVVAKLHVIARCLDEGVVVQPAVDAEEEGLLGSAAYTRRPAIPRCGCGPASVAAMPGCAPAASSSAIPATVTATPPC